MTALSQETHFLSLRKQQIAIPSGNSRITLKIPESKEIFLFYPIEGRGIPIGVKDVSISLPQ